MKVLGYRDLKSKGIPFTRKHIHTLVTEGKFPQPIKLGERTNGWVEAEIDRYIRDCVAQRDTTLRATA
jgi:prophage regulatory protein